MLLEFFNYAGKRRIEVRIVRRPHDAVLADDRREGGQGGLVRVVGDVAMALEVFARLQAEAWRPPRIQVREVAEAVEPGAEPAPAGFEDDYLQFRVVFEHAAAD